MKISIEDERKLGMIKSAGHIVQFENKYDEFFEIAIGNDSPKFYNEADASVYINKKYNELTR